MAAALGKPRLPFVEAAAVFLGNRLLWAIHHDFEQVNDSGEFARVQLAEQFVSLGFERVNGHGGHPARRGGAARRGGLGGLGGFGPLELR